MKIIYFIYTISLLLLISCKSGKSNKARPDMGTKIKFDMLEPGDDLNHMGYWRQTILKVNDKAPDITLFALNGEKFMLYEHLKLGKATLLVNGSLSCNKTNRTSIYLNNIVRRFKDSIDIYMIYTQESHPTDTLSPYNYNNIDELRAKTKYSNLNVIRPKYYQDRIDLATKLSKTHDLLIPVLVDNPDNTFWHLYGKSPNMAFFIAPDGKVYASQILFEPIKMTSLISNFLSHTAAQK